MLARMFCKGEEIGGVAAAPRARAAVTAARDRERSFMLGNERGYRAGMSVWAVEKVQASP